jgi:hypothetical protein
MVESQLSALLDVHDRLVAACVEGSVSVVEFLASYGDFYDRYALDGRGASREERDLFRRYGERIAFHGRVTRLLAGIASAAAVANPQDGGAEGLLPEVARLRLKQLVAQCPEFKAAPGDLQSCTQ